MFGIAVTIRDEMNRVRQRAKDAARKSFARTAFLIRESAIRSIKWSEEPSPAGEPPHTRERFQIQRAILYSADKEGAVIGPVASLFGTAGSAHEFGGPYKRGTFPERPFMEPALENNFDIFANSWSGSIGD